MGVFGQFFSTTEETKQTAQTLEKESPGNNQLDQFKALISTISEPIFAVEPDGTTFFFSDGAAFFLGVRQSDVVGKRFTDVVPLEPRDEIQKSLIQLIDDRQKNKIEANYKDFPVMIVITPLLSENNKLLGALMEIKDLRDKKRLQQMQVDFVSFVSHELRTPISSIKGYLDVLKNEADYLQPEHKKFLERAYLSNERQEKTVEKLLALSDLESGNVDISIERVQLDEVLREVMETWKTEAQKKNLTLTFVYPKFTIAPVKADRDLLRNVLDNLVENAIKYTETGEIDLSLSDKMGEVAIHIRDTGSGISDELKQQIFSKFVRGEHSLTETTQGNGLGLYLSKQFVEHMGGRIQVESVVGEGSTFTVTLQKYSDIH